MNSAELLNLAESVVELASYLDELKARSIFASGTVASVERGYLKPQEELALRQLQISYWQSRNGMAGRVPARAQAAR